MMKTVVKNTIAGLQLYKAARLINRRKTLIVMYHGLTGDNRLRDWTQVHIDDFERQMDYLARKYNPYALSDLAAGLNSNPEWIYPVAVTFDDGYRSNLTLALPILKKYNIPATVFVASGFIRGFDKRMGLLWPDFITAMLRSINDDQIDLADIGLKRFDLTNDNGFDRTRKAITEHLKSSPAAEKEKFLTWLENRFGSKIVFENFPEYHPLSLTEFKKLASDPLISIGGHSINHPILSRLKTDDISHEIAGCRKELEEMTATKVTAFAYPNGRIEDIGVETLAITSRHYECAVTTESGLNQRGQNKFLLRRYGIGRHFNFEQYKILISGVYHMTQKPIQDL
ncbi:MAG: polysaccharide deacetylase family protein [FCB group bacterium]|nr:polysaccharide deacetylase family protein [FCB group bacterium]